MSNPGNPVTPNVDPVTPAPQATPTPTAAQAPAAEGIAPTPVEPVQSAPVVEANSQAVVEPVAPKALESAPSASEPAKEAKPAETLIADGLDKTKNTPTPVEPPKAEEPKSTDTPTEGGQSDETAPPPKYDPFTLPEGTTVDEERIGQFTSLLSELELSGKADHAAVQAFGQKAVDFHISEVNKAIDEYYKKAVDTFEKQKNTWKEDFLKDPEMGGNRFQTTVDSALSFIRTHGGTPEQQTEFRNLMESSGLGNHPAMIRLLANAGRAMSEGTPLVAPKPAPAPKSKTQTMYGKT